MYSWCTRRAAGAVCCSLRRIKIRSLKFVKKYLTDYQSIKDTVLAGQFSKNAQPWFQYCNLISRKCCITQSTSVKLITQPTSMHLITQSTSMNLIRDFNAGKYYYHIVLLTIKCVFNFKFNLYYPTITSS